MIDNHSIAETEGQLSFDHAVIVVPSLETAIENFTTLGFQVQRGGANGPTHNALIYFSDGTYIELITPIHRSARIVFRTLHLAGLLGLLARRQPGVMARFVHWFGAPAGLRDWCIRCASLDKTVENFRALGLKTSDAMKFSRKRPDGQVAKWRLAGPLDTSLPFLIEDTSPTQIRVPFEDNCNHPNGVTGVSALVLSGAAQAATVQSLQQLFPDTAAPDSTCTIGTVEIRSLTGNNTPTELTLELSSSGEVKGLLARDKTFGTQIVLV